MFSSALFVNLAIASLLREPPDGALQLVERAERARETLGDALTPFGVDAPVPAGVTKALDVVDVTAPEAIGLDGWDMGYTLKAMQVALWCAHRAADFKEALIALGHAGGDTDTNGPWRVWCSARGSASTQFRNVGATGLPSCGRTGTRWRHGPTV